MGVRVLDDVGGCPRDAGFPAILVEACRSESDDVGMGWGIDWGQRWKSNWLTSTPVHGAGDSVRPDKGPQVLHRSEWKRCSWKVEVSSKLRAALATDNREEDLWNFDHSVAPVYRSASSASAR